MSSTDLEIAWLQSQTGITDPASIDDLRRALYPNGEYAYYAALSGLPAGSLADHKLAYYQAQTGLTSGSLRDCATVFWASGGSHPATGFGHGLFGHGTFGNGPS